MARIAMYEGVPGTREYARHTERKSRTKRWANPELKKKDQARMRELALLRRYGITIERYNQMLKQQNSSCAICNIHQLELKQPLCVDHCHTTDEVRGLLCSKCNFAIGLLNDDIQLLTNTIKYLS